MKTIATIIALIVIGGFALAATPQEDARFLNAVLDAYTKKDGSAVDALICFDNVKNADQIREFYSKEYPFYNYEIVSVGYQSPDPAQSTSMILNGHVCNWNLTIIKRINIVYKTPGTNTTLTLNIGEKNGKLLIAMLANNTNSIPNP